MKLDRDLKILSERVNSNYRSEREPALGTAQVYTIQSIRGLQKTISNLDKQNSKLQKSMLVLTIVTVILTVVQIVNN